MICFYNDYITHDDNVMDIICIGFHDVFSMAPPREVDKVVYGAYFTDPVPTDGYAVGGENFFVEVSVTGGEKQECNKGYCCSFHG